jgi:membrane protein implicated in regulation of membrane protease activity
VRDELQLARQELKEKVTALSNGARLLIAGLSIMWLALGTLIAAAVIGLATYIGAGYASLAIGLALAIVSAAVISIGVSRLKQTKLKPEQTIETLRENKEWLKELT